LLYVMCVLFDTLTFMSAPNINGILESDMSSIGKKNENKRKNYKCIKPIHLTSFGTKMDHIICMSLSFSSSISSVYYEFVYGIRDIGKPHSLIPNGIVDSKFFFSFSRWCFLLGPLQHCSIIFLP